jgi:NADPH2:quinone reductase
MKAAYIDVPGPAETIQYGDLPTPEPGPGQVRVKVGAAALNPIDVYIRAGTAPANLPRPFIVGSDLAGTVDAVGSGVTRFQRGDRVWGSNQGMLGRQGTCAEYACVAADLLYATPAGVGDVDAAAGALTGITAHLGLVEHARLQPGETVFVNGGTGGVGSMVVQIGKAIGARVITTVGSAEKAAAARAFGATGVINYKTEDVAARVKELTDGKGVNVWFETQRQPDLIRTVDLMAARGRIVLTAGRQSQATLPVGPFYVKGLVMYGFAMFNFSPDEQRRCADDLNQWQADGKLRAPIGRVFPLAETAAAQRLLEDNTLHGAGTLSGKVVVTP